MNGFIDLVGIMQMKILGRIFPSLFFIMFCHRLYLSSIIIIPEFLFYSTVVISYSPTLSYSTPFHFSPPPPRTNRPWKLGKKLLKSSWVKWYLNCILLSNYWTMKFILSRLDFIFSPPRLSTPLFLPLFLLLFFWPIIFMRSKKFMFLLFLFFLLELTWYLMFILLWDKKVLEQLGVRFTNINWMVLK